MSVRLHTETIGKRPIDIHVNTCGEFTAEFEDNEYTSKSLDDLRVLLRKAVTKAKPTSLIPVTIVGIIPHKAKGRYDTERFDVGPGAVHAQLRDKHEREYHVYLYQTDDGKQKFKRGGYGNKEREEVTCRRLTPAQIDRYVALRLARDEAVAALKAWVDDHAIDLDEAIATRNTKLTTKGDED